MGSTVLSRRAMLGRTTAFFSAALILAQLRSIPRIKAPMVTGRNNAGDYHMDNRGQLWFCTARGNPGTWIPVAIS